MVRHGRHRGGTEKAAQSLRLATSHSRTLLPAATASVAPSGEKATASTPPLGQRLSLVSVTTSLPEGTSHSRTVPGLLVAAGPMPPAASSLPPGWKATAK